METHLTLKHIVGYLPYRLKCLNQHLPDKELIIEELLGISNHITWCGIFNAKHGSNHVPVCGMKPILRPISDLTKEIEVNGEKFVPMNWFDENIFPKHNSPAVCFTDEYVEMCYLKEYEKLYEWHFDIHGLIEKGLAIDLNTIENGIQ